MESKEQLNSKKMSLKSQFEQVEMEIGEVKKRLNVQLKDMTFTQKTISSTESRLEQRRADRHSILQQCKVRREAFSRVFYWLV